MSFKVVYFHPDQMKTIWLGTTLFSALVFIGHYCPIVVTPKAPVIVITIAIQTKSLSNWFKKRRWSKGRHR